jgi:putative aldouronate transport system permease protein
VVTYRSPGRTVFEIINYTLFVLFGLVIVLPFLNVIATSLSSARAIAQNQVLFWPVEFYPQAYKTILTSPVFLTSLRNTVFISLLGTFLTMAVALCAGYALASKSFPLPKVALVFVLIPMYFSGGLIPFFVVVNKYGLNNSIFALVLPYVVSVFYILIFRNVIKGLPEEIMQSAEIDGASEPTILFRIVLPLILPTIMAFTIFTAVNFWNSWFSVLIFIRDQAKWTLQYMLRDLYMSPQFTGTTAGGGMTADDPANLHPMNIMFAALICTVAPIIVIYPFLQRYFIHGIIVGAVKG